MQNLGLFIYWSVFIDLTSLVQVFFRSTLFGTFLLYMPMGRGVTRRDPAHVTLKVKLCMHTMS